MNKHALNGSKLSVLDRKSQGLHQMMSVQRKQRSILMKPNVIQILETKGLRIPERDYEKLTKTWHQLKLQRNHLSEKSLKENDMALKYMAGDDHF